jgi:hypothetical protein
MAAGEAAMSRAIDRLAGLVQQAESRTRAQKLGQETRVAAERLSAAEDRMRVADRLLAETRPTATRDLEKADADDVLLKELTRKLAGLLNNLDPSQREAATREVDVAKAEIVATRKAAQEALEGAIREVDAARKELKAAREDYQKLRKELDVLLPHLASDFASGDRIARDSDMYFPAGQIQALAREVEDGERHFGALDQRQQFAQLKIWIGRFRRIQAWVESGEPTGLTDEEVQQLREIFPRLVGISKQYMPGYIEAFSRGFETDWDAYVVEATEQLQQAVETIRRDRDAELRRREAAAREQEQRRLAQEAGRAALGELRLIAAEPGFGEDDERRARFFVALDAAIKALGMSDPQLLDTLRPHAELLAGNPYRGLRRNLERPDPESARQEEIDAQREQYADLRAATRGRKVVMIGGDVREEKRRALRQVFEFDELEWVPYESARPVQIKSLEQRVRNHGMDLILILKEFVGHHVSESLRPLCEENGIPCLMVEHGYGTHQVAEALRRGVHRINANVPDEVG